MERKRIEKLVAFFIIGILLTISLFPFPVYASVQSQIVPTFSSSTSQWNTHLYITNFSDGTNTQASSTLAFTFDDDYYGVVYFDGYGPSNQHIANFATVYVAGGYGEYRYSYYQNGVINITNVSVSIVNVVKPDSSVDLTQIISLLTAIENDTSSIDNVMDSTLAQIRLVLAELIESNTYLNNIDDNLENIDNLIDTISWINIETNLGYRNNLSDTPTSWTGNIGAFNGYLTFSYSALRTYDNILKIYIPVAYNGSLSDIRLYFDNGTDVTDKYLLYITRSRIGMVLYMISDSSIGFNGDGNINIKGNYTYVYTPTGYYGKASLEYLPSTDIEYWQLKSFFINDKYLNIIANGTTQSNSASGSLDQTTSQFSNDANDLVTIEESFNNSMNQSLQNVNPTFNMGSSFLTSANWVSQQFNRLVNNTPFSSLITFGLTLGLGLLIIGKVRK